eukprot:5371414-Amphidinium_carterae.1
MHNNKEIASDSNLGAALVSSSAARVVRQPGEQSPPDSKDFNTTMRVTNNAANGKNKCEWLDIEKLSSFLAGVHYEGDGSCLFHSLSYGLGDGSDAGRLREEICSYIQANPRIGRRELRNGEA